MTARFYAPVSFATATVDLVGPEAHHLQNALRMKVGDEAILFDGEGSEATAVVEAVSKKSVSLKIVEQQPAPSETNRHIILATAVPKGERFRWLVEKTTELGVSRLIPLETEHSIVEPGTGKLDKMRQAVIAACKQCGRNRLMHIDEPTPWQQFIADEFAGNTAYIAHPNGVPVREELSRLDSDSEAPFLLVVGPEGGFTDEEVEQAIAKGAKLISLGSNILRIETAAIAMATLFSIGARK